MSKHIILYDNPHPSSHAAKILLRDDLRHSHIQYWLDVRLVYLNKFETLTCTYCGKTDLQVDGNKTKIKQLATIDHIIPISKGGAMYDESNFCVACYKCNQRKGNTLL